MRHVVPIVLSGGSGTRLWPLSHSLRPKQFIDLVGERTMLQDTLLRTRMLEHVEPPIVVCNESHRFLVAEQARAVGVPPRTIVLEPGARNTAPAVAAAAELARRAAPEGTEPVLLVLPADHVIPSGERFAAAVTAALQAAEAGRLVTFGIVPDKPETGYGYILKGRANGAYSEIEQFVEKPDRATAERFLASGRYLWNSGMFVFGARDYLAELARHAPAMLEACEAAVVEAATDADFTRLGAAFLGSPADSIDYAVMEKTDRAAVVELDAGWSDVGSWDALYEVVDKDGDGNAIKGDVVAEACRESLIAAHSRKVAVMGLENVVVVETEDAVLVVSRERSQDVKRIVETIEAGGSDTRGAAGEDRVSGARPDADSEAGPKVRS